MYQDISAHFVYLDTSNRSIFVIRRCMNYFHTSKRPIFDVSRKFHNPELSRKLRCDMWYGDSFYGLCSQCKLASVAQSDDPSAWKRLPLGGSNTWVPLKSCPACRSKQAENRARNKSARSITPALSSTSSAVTASSAASFSSVVPQAQRAASPSPVRGIPFNVVSRSPSTAGQSPSRAASIVRSPSPSVAQVDAPWVMG